MNFQSATVIAYFVFTGLTLAAPQSVAPAPATAQAPTDDAGWPTWRGPDGNGIAPRGNPPTEWSEEDNIRWKVAIPGLASSSPIVWKDRIYLMTAIETDRVEGEAQTDAAAAPRGMRGMRAKPSRIHEFVVLSLDRATGEIVWRTKVREAVPHEGGHSTSTQASGSPITDGEFIYAFFGSRGLHCLDLEGKLIWSRDFGRMRTMRSFGEGASPTLHGDPSHRHLGSRRAILFSSRSTSVPGKIFGGARVSRERPGRVRWWRKSKESRRSSFRARRRRVRTTWRPAL